MRRPLQPIAVPSDRLREDLVLVVGGLTNFAIATRRAVSEQVRTDRWVGGRRQTLVLEHETHVWRSRKPNAEASAGIEPAVRVLQTLALPIGDDAGNWGTRCYGVGTSG